MTKLVIRLWAVIKILYFSACFVIGISVMVIAFAVMLMSLGRLLMPRV